MKITHTLKMSEYTIGSQSSEDTYRVLQNSYNMNIRRINIMTVFSALLCFGLAIFLLSESQMIGAHWCVGIALLLTLISCIYGFIAMIRTTIIICFDGSGDGNEKCDYKELNRMINDKNDKLYENVAILYILIIAIIVFMFFSIIL